MTIQEKAKENQYPYNPKFGMWAVEITEHVSRNSFIKGYEICKKEQEEKLKKAISALKIEISYPDCTLTNSRGDTFTFKNNSKNEGLIDFLSLHEEGLVSFLQ